MNRIVTYRAISNPPTYESVKQLAVTFNIEVAGLFHWIFCFCSKSTWTIRINTATVQCKVKVVLPIGQTDKKPISPQRVSR